MSIKQHLKLYEEFCYFIREREKARINKEAGVGKPWSYDPIIQKYKFCNVNREDDTVTKWIAEHIRGSESGFVWFHLVVARFFNKPEALKDIEFGSSWNPEKVKKILDDKLANGEKIFNAAYIISGSGSAGKLKHHYLIDDVFTPIWQKRSEVKYYWGCQEWADWFRKFTGLGDFLTNQIITDMKYTHILDPLCTLDWMDFVLAGPGTKRGLKRIYGNSIDQNIAAEIFPVRLRGIREALCGDVPELEHIFYDLNNLSNCFCEFDKYMRAKNGEGRPKQKYPGAY